IADANEAWTLEILHDCLAACREARVSLIEQPLPANADAALDDRDRSIPICADESLHDRHHLAEVLKRYEVINIKLDKTGGLTEA
ncbi:enolase C-terminal domain-like protein, partial [Acinetobacter baumannii]